MKIKYFHMKLLKNNSNYKFLVEKRYNFIKSNIDKESISLEIGAGNSDLEKYLHDSSLIKSDIVYNKNNDLIFDCHKIPFKDNLFDNVVCLNCIHHFSNPIIALSEIIRVLKVNGKILIIEPNSSPILRLILKFFNHEDYNEQIDYFKIKNILKKEPNYGNNAIASLLFSENSKFFEIFNDVKLTSKNYTELLVFLNSSGVGVNMPYIPLPLKLLKFIDYFDKTLIRISKKFALCQEIIIIKYKHVKRNY